MRLLLDTHVFLLSATEPETLSASARNAIVDPANEVFVSAAVAWEISIKVAAEKLALPGDPAAWFPARLRALAFDPLHISVEHALAAGALPDIHKDPFDRIMIAQAQIEGLTFVTRDPQNRKYAVRVLPA
ncbi:MAG TPA: type II toxin-antitoxin system VapC family toxin [Candidatus Baltobacteraceae bacterium]